MGHIGAEVDRMIRGAKPTRKAAKRKKVLELAFGRGRLTVKVLRGLKQTLLRIAIAKEKRERVRKQNRAATEAVGDKEDV